MIYTDLGMGKVKQFSLKASYASTKYQSFQYNSSFQRSRSCYILEKLIVSHDPIHKIMYSSLAFTQKNESEKKTLQLIPLTWK